jgi:hypothetical protein
MNASLLRGEALGQFVAGIGRRVGNQIKVVLQALASAGGSPLEEFLSGFNGPNLLSQCRGDPYVERNAILPREFLGAIQKRFRNLQLAPD